MSPAQSDGVDFAALYDAHPEYSARRDAGSFERQLVELEVRQFKLPQLLALLTGERLSRVVEIGCATGELIAAFPLADRDDQHGHRMGLDISPENIATARERFPEVEFQAGDFRQLDLPPFDAVVLSDVLEHVPDDAAFLADAAKLAPLALVNLPLEDNWLNRHRDYGPHDVSGHLRCYSLQDGLELAQRAGLEVMNWQRVWIHEGPAEAARRQLRRDRFGSAFSGGIVTRTMRRLAFGAACAIPPLGRRLFASNLFFAARQRRSEGPRP